MKRIMLKSPLRIAATAITLGLVLIFIAGLAVDANGWLRSSRRPTYIKNPAKAQPKPEAVSTVAPATATPQPGKTRIGSELISISRFGLETREITRPVGKFFLLVENRSGINPITLRLQSDRGQRIIEVTPPQDQLDWADELNLPPGHYTLTIAERPAWVCEITITTP
jgi:hypothetical protein